MAISQPDRPFNYKLVEFVVISFIFIAGLAGGVFISQTVFDSVPHVEDEQSYLFQAKVFAKGMIYAPAPRDPSFFAIPFVVDYQGKWFGKYPPGYPLVLATGVLLGSPWLVDPVLGGLSAVLLYLLGRSLYSTTVGALGAVLCISSPFFVFLSGSFMSHPAALFFSLIFFLSFVKVYRNSSRIYALLAGFALGMVFLTRPLTGIALGMPFVILCLIDLWRRRTVVFRKYLLVALAFALVAALLPGFNYVLTGNPWLNTYELWWPFDRIGFGDQLGMNGHSLGDGLQNAWNNLTLLANDLFGWPFYLSLVFIPVPLLIERNVWDSLLLAVFLSLVVFHTAYWADGIMYGPRYYFEALPALVLLTARGLTILAGQLDVGLRKLNPTCLSHLGLLVVLATTAGLMVWNIANYLPPKMAFYRDWDGMNGDELRTVAAAGVHNVVVFVTQIKQYGDYGSVVSAIEPTLDSDVVFAIDRQESNIFLMEQYPDKEYYRLKQGNLEKIVPAGQWPPF